MALWLRPWPQHHQSLGFTKQSKSIKSQLQSENQNYKNDNKTNSSDSKNTGNYNGNKSPIDNYYQSNLNSRRPLRRNHRLNRSYHQRQSGHHKSNGHTSIFYIKLGKTNVRC